MSNNVHVLVVDEGLYIGHGLVNRWLGRVSNSLYHNIVAEAPQRSGLLKSLIGQGSITHESLRVLSTEVTSNAPYSRYVIGGTAEDGAGYIYSTQGARNIGLIERMLAGNIVTEDTSGLWLVINDGGKKFHLRVHGQRANNFMAAGYNRTARTHRALNPIFPGLIT